MKIITNRHKFSFIYQFQLILLMLLNFPPKLKNCGRIGSIPCECEKIHNMFLRKHETFIFRECFEFLQKNQKYWRLSFNNIGLLNYKLVGWVGDPFSNVSYTEILKRKSMQQKRTRKKINSLSWMDRKMLVQLENNIHN